MAPAMKVVWICNFSNIEVRSKVNPKASYFEQCIRRILGLPKRKFEDTAVWITNAINEVQYLSDVELHVISPHKGMKSKIESFSLNGIHYHFFRSETDRLYQHLKQFCFKVNRNEFIRNRTLVKGLISNIHPDIIHLYGAENPNYSSIALDINPGNQPLLISLQTLMNDKYFKDNYAISDYSYSFRSEMEKKILERAKYISTSIQKYRSIVWETINPNALFFPSFLAVGEPISASTLNKQYDFVYFAASISKAANQAVEAFCLACRKYENLQLLIVGGTPQPFTRNLQKRIKELGIEKNVVFSGKLQTHEEVIRTIQLAKFALLPMSTILSGTLREALFVGMPIITTIVTGTPELNERRNTVLLSPPNDYSTMAANMIKLIENDELVMELSKNAILTATEKWNNQRIIGQLVNTYRAIISSYKSNVPIPEEICAKYSMKSKSC